MDIREFNRRAWDREVDKGNPWTQPFSPEVIARARHGDWSVLLTENIHVPREWFPSMSGLSALGLACGGGQQGPVFAAAGADVTIFDNSPKQLECDRQVAEREGLQLTTIEGDMRNLSIFANDSFDLVFHPVSNLFVEDIHPVWKEASRLVRHQEILLAGFMNPVYYLFDFEEMDQQGILDVRYKIPYSDVDVYGIGRIRMEDRPAEFGHTLTAQIGGQIEAGFMITGFYKDYHAGQLVSEYTPTYIATRAIKL